VRPHLPEEELHAWLDGQLSRAQASEIAEHILGCLICRALEAEVRGVRDRTTTLLALAARK
jgi:anti-sigma factor RsiW